MAARDPPRGLPCLTAACLERCVSAQMLPRAVEAAAAAPRHVAAADQIDVETLNECSRQFVQSLQVRLSCAASDASCAHGTDPRAAFYPPQDAHGTLRSDIEEAVQPQPYRHTTHEASARSMLVGLRAALMAEHVKGMLQSLDSTFPTASSPAQEGTSPMT